MDATDQVGWIVGEEEGQGGWYIYACNDHTPSAMREIHRVLLRDEAQDAEATCTECGLDLGTAEAMHS